MARQGPRLTKTIGLGNLISNGKLADTGEGRVVERRKQTSVFHLYFRMSLAGKLPPPLLLNRFIFCRKPDELVTICYTQRFTFWNGSGDPGEKKSHTTNQ